MRFILFALGLACSVGCSSEAPRPSSERQLVIFSTDRPENAAAITERIRSERTAAVTSLRIQMWSVEQTDLAALRTLESEGRLTGLHVEPGESWPVLREMTTSNAHEAALRGVIGAAQPSSYVIGQLAREVPLSFALTSGFSISMPLPAGGAAKLEAGRQVDERNWEFDVNEGGHAALSTEDGGLRGTVQTPNGVFLIRPLPNGDHVIFAPQRPTVPDEPPHTPAKPVVKEEAALDLPPPTCADDTLRVLPLNTQEVEVEVAKMRLGSVAAIANDAQSDTRLAIRANKLDARVEVLPPVRVTFRHDPDLLKEVATLTTRANTPTDEIAKLRASASADVVMLFSTAQNACGAVLPAVLRSKIARPDQAFFVMTPLIAACTFTFTHELSHLLGMRHHDDATSAAEPLAYGFCETGNSFSTITATFTSCSGGRRLLWSDPNAKIVDGQGKSFAAGDKVRHWEASIVARQFKAAAAYHCLAR